jgi:hypothetical protein
MEEWIKGAMPFLKKTLTPPRRELNELNWKSALSPDHKK